jgi:hypothetical protein
MMIQTSKYKKILMLLLALYPFFAAAQTPIIVENFGYTAGDTLRTINGAGWIPVGTVSNINKVPVVSPGLSYTGSTASGIGNAVAIKTTGEDIGKAFAQNYKDNAIYTSFLINVSAAQTAGDYFFALSDSTLSGTNFRARTFIKSSGTGYKIGISKSGVATVAGYYATDLSFNTTYQIVVKYSIISGLTNDSVKLFVNPVLGAAEPTTAGAEGLITENDITISNTSGLGGVALRQGTAPNAPTLIFDGLIVGRTWSSVTTLSTSSGSTLPSYVPTNGLVAYYPFNGNANDASGNGNNGTINGATLTTDKSGNLNSAYNFNGQNNNIVVPDNITINPSLISVSIWVNPAVFGPSEQYIINKSIDILPGSVNRSWAIRISSDGQLNLEIRVNNTYYLFGSTETLTLNQWNNLVFVYDGSTAKLYKNNIVVINQSLPGTLTNLSYNLSIGNFPHANMPPYGYFWNGKLDDIGIWNRALTQSEVTTLYNQAPNPVLPSNVPTWQQIGPVDNYKNIIRLTSGNFATSANGDVYIFPNITSPFTGLNYNSQIGSQCVSQLLGENAAGSIFRASCHNGIYQYNNSNWSLNGLSGYGTSGQYWNKLSSGRLILSKGGFLRNIYYSDNNGANWTSAGLGDVDWNFLVVSQNQSLFAVSCCGGTGLKGLIKSTDNGTSWSYLNSAVPLSTARCVANDLNGALYVIADDLSIKKSTNDGNTWSPFSTTPNNEIGYNLLFNQNAMFLFTLSGANFSISKIYYSPINSINWQDISTSFPSNTIFNEMKNLDGKVFICTNNGLFYANTATTAASDSLWVINTQSDTLIFPNKIKVSLKSNDLSAKNIISYEIKLSYDQTKLIFDSVSLNNTASANGLIVTNNNTTGLLKLVWARSTKLTGTLPLLNCFFSPIDSGKSKINISYALFNTDTVRNLKSKTLINKYNFGDIDLNSFIQAYDGMVALRYSVGMDPIPLIDPLPWENWRVKVASVDSSAIVTANDASLILKYVVGLINQFPKRGLNYSNGYVLTSIENNEIVFRSFGNLQGLNVSFLNQFDKLNPASFIFSNDAISAVNILDNIYKVGIAFNNSPDPGSIILKIPIKGELKNDLNVELYENENKRLVNLNKSTSITSESKTNHLIFPNPTTNLVNIIGLGKTETEVSIYDIQGKLILSRKIIDQGIIDMSDLYNGVYLLKIGEVVHRVTKL